MKLLDISKKNHNLTLSRVHHLENHISSDKAIFSCCTQDDDKYGENYPINFIMSSGSVVPKHLRY
jgi:hypothetical protein